MKKYIYNSVWASLLSIATFSFSACEQDDTQAPVLNPNATFEEGDITFSVSTAFPMEGETRAAEAPQTFSQTIADGIEMETTITADRQAVTRALSDDKVDAGDAVLIIAVDENDKVLGAPRTATVTESATLTVHALSGTKKFIFFSYGTSDRPDSTWIKRGDDINDPEITWEWTHAGKKNLARAEYAPGTNGEKKLEFTHVLISTLDLTVKNALTETVTYDSILLLDGALGAASLNVDGKIASGTPSSVAIGANYTIEPGLSPRYSNRAFIPDVNIQPLFTFYSMTIGTGGGKKPSSSSSRLAYTFKPGYKYTANVTITKKSPMKVVPGNLYRWGATEVYTAANNNTADITQYPLEKGNGAKNDLFKQCPTLYQVYAILNQSNPVFWDNKGPEWTDVHNRNAIRRDGLWIRKFGAGDDWDHSLDQSPDAGTKNGKNKIEGIPQVTDEIRKSGDYQFLPPAGRGGKNQSSGGSFPIGLQVSGSYWLSSTNLDAKGIGSFCLHFVCQYPEDNTHTTTYDYVAIESEDRSYGMCLWTPNGASVNYNY
jgi:hypothetical protein